jgi:hypothetical protein
VAAHLRRALGTEVEMIHGRYGEFKVLVDGEVVVDAGAVAALGILPTRRHVLVAVQKRLQSGAP